MGKPIEIAAKVYLGALWVVCVYRAATQSIVHDEALVWQMYLADGPGPIFQVFSANHHFLNTLLMYLCVSLFGTSEWSMRIPSLAGAALYFAAVYRVCRYAFGSGYQFLLAVGLATLNPFILDFMVAARGYGLALALCMWSLALLLPYIDDPKQRTARKLVEAGVALALSVVANLVFAIPAAVLAGMAMWLLRKPAATKEAQTKETKKKARRKIAEEPSVAVCFVVPIAAVAVVFFLISPLSSASAGAFYAGSENIVDSIRNLASVSLDHGGPWSNGPAAGWIRDAAGFVFAPVILVAG